jgi:hypothetical protein
MRTKEECFMSDSSTKKLATINALIDRYKNLPRHGNRTINSYLDVLREIQIDSLGTVYEKYHETKEIEAVRRYYLENLHSGQNLDKVVSDAELALKMASRLEETYELLVNALEFSITAQELDDALLVGLPAKKIKVADLKAHISGAKQMKARLRHAELLRPIGPGLAPYAHSRFAYAAFKIAMLPLRATGLAPIVELLSRGFDVLRNLEDVEGCFENIIHNNKQSIKQLYST